MRVRSPQELGVLVRQQRKDQELSQEALADRIGATRQWVRMLEQGKPRLELGLTLRALTALGLGVDIREMLPAGEARQRHSRDTSDIATRAAAGPKRMRGGARPHTLPPVPGAARGVDIDAIIEAARGTHR